jgi:hypothetical protein
MILTELDDPSSSPRLVVPAYFHPAVRPREWASLTEHARHIRVIVHNPGSGPGEALDESFIVPLGQLRAAGVQVIGYVDTNYGLRPPAEVLADFERHLGWYGVSGVFFDRVPTGPDDVAHYARLSREARQTGADTVAFNHGAYPVEAYAEHGDLLGTFEGTWDTYVGATVPRWSRSRPAAQFFHLIYQVPHPCFSDAFLLVARRRTGCVYVTDRGGVNPWDRLPACEYDPQLY